MSSNGNNKFQYSSNFNTHKHDAQSCVSIRTPIGSCQSTEDIKSIQRKIEVVTKHLKPHIIKILNVVIQNNPDNARIICDYIIAEQNEINIKESTKETKIKKIAHLSKYFHHQKTFYDMTKDDLLNYLNSLRKSSIQDPTHKSIGTWNSRQMLFLKFFRWLYNPDEPDIRRRDTPDCMKGIKQLPRSEKSPYKPEDMWSAEEHAIFLKYCPSPRDRCYHSMANDTSARPHEIINLKIKDVKFKISSEGIQYAEITVNGKTGPRTLPLIDCIPYLKEWLLSHPYGNIQDSWLFISLSDKNGLNSKNNNSSINNPKPIIIPQLSVNGLLKRYKIQYLNLFHKLLEDKEVPDVDKSLIRNILTKPFNLYILRHSALTEKSKIVKEHILRSHYANMMENESDVSKTDSIYLKVSIVEPILVSCIDYASFSEIYSYLQRVFPNISESGAKEYLFYLINAAFISYDGSNKIYSISQDGIDLLEIIYSQKNVRVVDYLDLTVKVE